MIAEGDPAKLRRSIDQLRSIFAANDYQPACRTKNKYHNLVLEAESKLREMEGSNDVELEPTRKSTRNGPDAEALTKLSNMLFQHQQQVTTQVSLEIAKVQKHNDDKLKEFASQLEETRNGEACAIVASCSNTGLTHDLNRV
jgi:hypothetical protein